MIKERNLLGKRSFTVGLFFLVTISSMLSANILQNSVNASVANLIAEKNSTFSDPKSNTANDGVGMTFVIPNTPVNNNSTVATPNATSTPLTKNGISIQQSNENNETPSKKDDSTSKPISKATNNTSSDSTQVNKMQRGEYKVDENGIHYYNINNCSEVKGSSGIGDLSECEDAAKQMKDDM